MHRRNSHLGLLCLVYCPPQGPFLGPASENICTLCTFQKNTNLRLQRDPELPLPGRLRLCARVRAAPSARLLLCSEPATAGFLRARRCFRPAPFARSTEGAGHGGLLHGAGGRTEARAAAGHRPRRPAGPPEGFLQVGGARSRLWDSGDGPALAAFLERGPGVDHPRRATAPVKDDRFGPRVAIVRSLWLRLSPKRWMGQ